MNCSLASFQTKQHEFVVDLNLMQLYWCLLVQPNQVSVVGDWANHAISIRSRNVPQEVVGHTSHKVTEVNHQPFEKTGRSHFSAPLSVPRFHRSIMSYLVVPEYTFPACCSGLRTYDSLIVMLFSGRAAACHCTSKCFDAQSDPNVCFNAS